MGTEISYHQSQVGHEADEQRAKRAEEETGSFNASNSPTVGGVLTKPTES